MTLRALLLGLALGLLVSAFTFFNDGVIRQTYFINNHLPISVFGSIALLLIGLNPLLHLLGRRAPLTVGEVAVIAALGLAACGWPSFAFFWSFVPSVATPTHWLQSQLGWQANHVMTYVPGVSWELGHGHVRDWDQVVTVTLASEADESDSVPSQIWRYLPTRDQETLRRLHEQRASEGELGDLLTMIFNRVIRDAPLEVPDSLDTTRWPAEVSRLAERQRSGAALSALERTQLNRWLLATAFDEQVLPPPAGNGALVAGRPGAEAAVDMVVEGRASREGSLVAIPWKAWWPTLRLWGGLALLLGLGALCLSLMVHPQWSRRELLSYPLAEFVSQFSQRDEGRALPKVAYQQVFWWGLGAAMAVHLVNGLNAWFPALPKIPLHLELGALRELFPNASRVQGAGDIVRPYLYLSAIAFAFFLSTNVSFSVGISTIVYIAMGGTLLGAGVVLEQDYFGEAPIGLVRFGSYVGMAVMIFYVGRHYYSQLAGGVIGLRRSAEAPPYAVWAARALVLCGVLAVVVLRQSGLDWVLASLFVTLVMLMFLIMSRIVAETGLFFVQAWWMPVAVLTAGFGIEEVGPTSYILLAVASIVIVADPRTTLMPYLTTGLQMIERSGTRVSGRIAWPMLGMIVVGFFVAGLAAMSLVHDRGVFVTDEFAARLLPVSPFNRLSTYLADMHARNTLVHSTVNDGLTDLASLQPSPHACLWIGVGIALILITALARLRLPWWPIHPVLFLIWGTMPASRLAVSFLIGWAIKMAVIKTVGSRGYHQVLPMMIGVIAGEVLIGLIWIGVGALYYATTGMSPPTYRIYP